MAWRGEQYRKALEARVTRSLHVATIAVESRAKDLLSVPGTAPRGPAGRDKSGRFTKAKVYGAIRSRPGEPPRKQLGHLRRSVAREVVSLKGRVGTNVKYGRWLELGTGRMAARPWLRRSLAERKDAIRMAFRRG